MEEETRTKRATVAHTPTPWVSHTGSVYVDGPNDYPPRDTDHE